MENFRAAAWELAMALVGTYFAVKDLRMLPKKQLVFYIIISICFGYVAAPVALEVLSHKGWISGKTNDSLMPFCILFFSAFCLKIFDLLSAFFNRAKSIKLPGGRE